MEIILPETIYKYRDWNNCNHRRLLLNNELYVPSVYQLNDPFDCLIKSDYDFLKSEGLTDRVLNLYYEEFGNKIQELGYKREELLNNGSKEIHSVLLDLKMNSDLYSTENRQKHLGVISFSKLWDNPQMWSHYSNNHTGFCVGFDSKKLKDSDFFLNGGCVQYQSEYPKVNPLDNGPEITSKVVYVKSKGWDYESEYRMTKLYGFDRNNDRFEKQKIFSFNDEIIKEVILGLKISDNSRDDILKECEKRRLRVYQIEEISGQFILKRSRIN